MRHNIAKLYLCNFLAGLVFWYSIEKLFMYKIGISAFGVSVNAVVLVIVTSIFDVPFGVLADRWNRKYTLALGVTALGVASLITGASHSLLVYTLGTAIYGIYLCMTNGTFQAITYDSLKEVGKEKLYAKHQGGSYALFMAGIAIASPVGGYMAAHFGYRSTYYWSAVLCAVNLLVILSMHEPAFHKSDATVSIRKHIGAASRLLFTNTTLTYLSSILLVTGILRSSLNEYAGLYFIAIGFGAIGSGWANGGKWLFGAIGQFLASRLARVFPYMIAAFFVAFIGMSSWRTPLGLAFFYLCTFSYGIILNEAQAMVQDKVPSDVRATIFSLINFGTSALMIPLGLAFGVLAQHYSVFAAYQLFAVIGLLYFGLWLGWRKKVRISTVDSKTVSALRVP
jgi:MFS family permease